MKTYSVIIEEKVRFAVTVEAETVEAANRKAMVERTPKVGSRKKSPRLLTWDRHIIAP